MMEDGQPYNPYRVFLGNHIPNWLMKTRAISPGAKLLWGLLARHAGKDGICYPSYEILGMEMGYSIDSIGRQIKELQDAKLIKVIKPSGKEYLHHKNNRYKFTWNSDLIENEDDPVGIPDPDPVGIPSDKNTVIDSYISNSKESKDSLKGDSVESPSQRLIQSRFQRTSPIISSPETSDHTKPEYVKPGTAEYAVVTAWNKLLPPARQHVNLGTKTILQVVRYLEQMRNGTFGDLSRRQWDGKWMDKHKINYKEFAERKWSFREICGTIEGPLGDMYKEGFWPPDKSSLPKSLADAFYNPRTRSSFFVLVFYDPPGLLKVQSVKDPYPDITEELVREGVIQMSQMKIGDWKEYFKGVRGLEEYLKKIDWDNYGAKQMFGLKGGDLYLLIMQYVRWMKGEAPDLLPLSKAPDRFHVGMIRPDFWMWKKFTEGVNRYWGNVFKNVVVSEDD